MDAAVSRTPLCYPVGSHAGLMAAIIAALSGFRPSNPLLDFSDYVDGSVTRAGGRIRVHLTLARMSDHVITQCWRGEFTTADAASDIAAASANGLLQSKPTLARRLI